MFKQLWVKRPRQARVRQNVLQRGLQGDHCAIPVSGRALLVRASNAYAYRVPEGKASMNPASVNRVRSIAAMRLPYRA